MYAIRSYYGLLTLTQSIGVIMGANIGTTITAWIVSLVGFKMNVSALALPAVGIGFVLMMAVKWGRKDLGEAILGFGILFLGLDFLTKSMPKIVITSYSIHYTKLYDEKPMDVAPGASFLDNLNPDSLDAVSGAYGEPCLLNAKEGERFQFERVGYFARDPETVGGKPVFNRAVGLRDTWAKLEKKAGA